MPSVLRCCREHVKASLQLLDCDKGGVVIMGEKAEMLFFHIYDIKTPAALILKQEALSIGADFALPKNAILGQVEYVDGLLMVSLRLLPILCEKLTIQPFGLKAIAKELKQHQNRPKDNMPKLMGVINLTPDSFYPQSRVSPREAMHAIHTMIQDGADIIDIGAASSRPGSAFIHADIEKERIRDVLAEIKRENLTKDVCFSIDSYNADVVRLALDAGFLLINDITGMQNKDMRSVAIESHAAVVVMHMLGKPLDMQSNPSYQHVVQEVDTFFIQQIQHLHDEGFKGEIILDVGIGFGKRVQDNLDLIMGIEHFLYHKMPILVGASRKSLIGEICNASVEERLAGSLALHLRAVEKGASIIRCHDVKEHRQAFMIEQSLKQRQQ